MPFYLLALSLAPATIYFKNGNNWRDVHFWVNAVLFFPIFLSSFGHIVAIGHAWWFIYNKSTITGRNNSSYLNLPNDQDVLDDDNDSLDGGLNQHTSSDNPFHQDSIPTYNEATGKQPLSSNTDLKIQV